LLSLVVFVVVVFCFLNNCVLTTVATSLEYRFYYRAPFISRHLVVGAAFLYTLQLRSVDRFSYKITTTQTASDNNAKLEYKSDV
jgi:hypothetical protein